MELQPYEKALGRHIVISCLEARNDSIDDYLPDDVEYDWDGWTIEHVDGDETAIEVVATQEDSESVKVKNARYNPPGKAHPAEYEHYEGTIVAHARIDWSDDPLAGDSHITLDWEGGAPSPPDPDPHEV